MNESSNLTNEANTFWSDYAQPTLKWCIERYMDCFELSAEWTLGITFVFGMIILNKLVCGGKSLKQHAAERKYRWKMVYKYQHGSRIKRDAWFLWSSAKHKGELLNEIYGGEAGRQFPHHLRADKFEIISLKRAYHLKGTQI